MEQSPDIILKTIFVGLGAVGKTSICKRLDGLDWKQQYTTTIGMNLFNYTMELNGDKVETIIYDTGGQQLFQTLNKFFYRGAVGAVIVYDISDRTSFESIPEWMETIRKETGVVPLLIIGNKIDLERDRVVELSELEDQIKVWEPKWQIDNLDSIFNRNDLPIRCVETSAKSSEVELIGIIEDFIKMLYRLTS